MTREVGWGVGGGVFVPSQIGLDKFQCDWHCAHRQACENYIKKAESMLSMACLIIISGHNIKEKKVFGNFHF